MPISTGNPVAFRIDDMMCEIALEQMAERGEISWDEVDFLTDNVDFKTIAEEIAGGFEDWFDNQSLCYSDVMDEITVHVREDAAYRKMIAERHSS